MQLTNFIRPLFVTHFVHLGTIKVFTMYGLLTTLFSTICAHFDLMLGTQESRESLCEQGLFALCCIWFELILSWLVLMAVFVDINDHPFLIWSNFLVDLQLELWSRSRHKTAFCFRLFEPMLTSFFVHVRTLYHCRRLILVLSAHLYCLCLIYGQISAIWDKKWLANLILIFLPYQFLREDVLGHGFLMAALIRISLMSLKVVLVDSACKYLDILRFGLCIIFLKFRFADSILLASFLSKLLQVFACISSLLFQEIDLLSLLLRS